MSEAAELELMIQTLTAKQQVGCLIFVLSWMSTKPEWPILKEGLDIYAQAHALQSRYQHPQVYQDEGQKPKGYRTMSEDATKEQHEAEDLSHALQTLPVEEQAGCLRFVLGWMGARPEWPALKEAVEFYLKESRIALLEE